MPLGPLIINGGLNLDTFFSQPLPPPPTPGPNTTIQPPAGSGPTPLPPATGLTGPQIQNLMLQGQQLGGAQTPLGPVINVTPGGPPINLSPGASGSAGLSGTSITTPLTNPATGVQPYNPQATTTGGTTVGPSAPAQQGGAQNAPLLSRPVFIVGGSAFLGAAQGALGALEETADTLEATNIAVNGMGFPNLGAALQQAQQVGLYSPTVNSIAGIYNPSSATAYQLQAVQQLQAYYQANGINIVQINAQLNQGQGNAPLLAPLNPLQGQPQGFNPAPGGVPPPPFLGPVPGQPLPLVPFPQQRAPAAPMVGAGFGFGAGGAGGGGLLGGYQGGSAGGGGGGGLLG